jgi:maltooligosyltrehalose trehalohydrolase
MAARAFRSRLALPAPGTAWSSQVVDPAAYRWRDGGWKGVALAGQVLYELHIGTFTTEGTWDAAARELPPFACAA